MTTKTDSQARTHRDALNAAFRTVRRNGGVAKPNFWSSRTCGWAAMRDEHPSAATAIFYTKQDADAFREHQGTWGASSKKTATLSRYLWLAHDSDSQMVVDALRAEGLDVKWVGSSNTRIEVLATPVATPVGK